MVKEYRRKKVFRYRPRDGLVRALAAEYEAWQLTFKAVCRNAGAGPDGAGPESRR